MINYSFDSLNDKEFEELVNDLLTKHFGQRIVRYAPGRDLGIDGKVKFGDSVFIVQSKHYINSRFSNLLSSLRNERDKLSKLKIDKYIVATSLNLTPGNVDELVKILYPFLKEEDIYYRARLNDLLKDYPDIEKQHYKLWLTSTKVLEHLINKGVYNLSKFTLEDARKKLKKYTKTASHEIAMKKLLDEHCVIITGEPGVGKTTLAQQLCNEIVSKGYQFFDVDHNIDEAFQVYSENEKQIFYYDDFLGSNYLEAFENNKDSKIVKFINAISSRDNNHKLFILTSRASIFSQGLIRSDKFSNNNVESNGFILNINALTLLDKALILYNHIYHSGLDDVYKTSFFEDEFYLKIIKHQNFNPRLIEFITCTKRIKHVDSKHYTEHIKNSLDDPRQIWSHAFTTQLKEIERVIVYFVAFSAEKLREFNVFSYVTTYFESKKITLDDESFNKAMHTLKGSFILNEISRDGEKLRLFNPSIKDYLIAKLETEDELSKLIFTILNQPLTIEVTYPVSKFQRKISKSLVLSYCNYDLDKYYDLFLRCLTNTINFRDGIDDELCSKFSKKIFSVKNTKPLEYSELVVIGRYIEKNKNYETLADLFDMISLRAFSNISNETLVVLVSILKCYVSVCDDLKHKADSYYADSFEHEDDSDDIGNSYNAYEYMYEFFYLKLNSLCELFEKRTFDFWRNNHSMLSYKRNRKKITSSELFNELHDVLVSYNLISLESIESFMDELNFSDVDEIIFEERLQRKLDKKIKKSTKAINEDLKIRELFTVI